MDFRKLISFGSSSHVISLPKEWIDKNNLKKGATLFIDNSDDKLIISSRDIKKESEEIEIRIDITGKNIEIIEKIIFSKYLNDFTTMIITGEDLDEKLDGIRSIIQNLMAVEITEQSKKKVIAQNFLKLEDIDPEGLIRKIDRVVKEMMIDLKKGFESDLTENLTIRDKDVNRLSFLISKLIKHLLKNKAHKVNVSRHITYWMVSYHLEKMGDQVKRLARLMNDVKPGEIKKEGKENAIKIIDEIIKFYSEGMKLFASEKKELGFILIENTEEIYNLIDKFSEENPKSQQSIRFSEKAKDLAAHAANIIRSICEIE